jgi:hypothetical protein
MSTKDARQLIEAYVRRAAWSEIGVMGPPVVAWALMFMSVGMLI